MGAELKYLTFILGVLLCASAQAQQVPHPTNGPGTSTINKLACYKNLYGSSLGECDANDIIPQRLLLSNSLTGDQGAALKGGVELITTTDGAISKTDVGKINALYVVNKFGALGGPNAKEGQRAGIFAKVQQDGPTDFTSNSYQFNTGSWSWVLVNQGNTTPGTEPNYHAFGGLVELGGVNTRAFNLMGMEVDVNIAPSVVVGNRQGVLAAIGAGTFGASERALYFDGAFAIGRSGAFDATWKVGYAIRSPNGVWPFAADSVILGGDTNNSGVPAGSPAVPAVVGTGIDFRFINFNYMEYVSDSFFIDPHGSIGITGATFPAIKMRDISAPVNAGGLIRWVGVGGSWELQINTAPAGDFGSSIDALVMSPTGGIGFGAEIKPKSSTVAGLPVCDLASRGSLMAVIDASTPAYHTTLVGGGAVWVPAFCDGASWKAH